MFLMFPYSSEVLGHKACAQILFVTHHHFTAIPFVMTVYGEKSFWINGRLENANPGHNIQVIITTEKLWNQTNITYWSMSIIQCDDRPSPNIVNADNKQHFYCWNTVCPNNLTTKY